MTSFEINIEFMLWISQISRMRKKLRIENNGTISDIKAYLQNRVWQPNFLHQHLKPRGALH